MIEIIKCAAGFALWLASFVISLIAILAVVLAVLWAAQEAWDWLKERMAEDGK